MARYLPSEEKEDPKIVSRWPPMQSRSFLVLDGVEMAEDDELVDAGVD